MKPYRDIFKKPITKDDVELAVSIVVTTGKTSAFALNRYMQIGMSKVSRIIGLLEDAGVVSKRVNGERTLILKNQAGATNAALRQLKKGKK